MWRNSLSFSSKLVASSNPNHPKSTLLLSGVFTVNYGFERSVSHSEFYSASASSPSSADSLKSGFPRLDRARSFGFSSSAAVVEQSSLAAASASKARDVVDLARHYGRCYWELSKARL
ncbi:hypothetical protein F0562_028157, partial [Nyssa sinensis]